MIIHLVQNQVEQSQEILSKSVDFIKQTFPSVEKVRSFSKSYIASYLSKALIASVALSCLNISFSTSFPICLALVVFISFKDFTTFALQGIKKAMHTIAQRSREYLTRIAQVISDIFEATCRFSSSFFLQTIYLKEKALSSNKKSFVNQAVVTNTKPFIEEALAFDEKFSIEHAVVTNTEPFIEEALDEKFSISQAVVVTNTEPFIKKALQIQEDKQTVRLAEILEIAEKPKQSKILSKFNQLCAENLDLLFIKKSYTFRSIFSTPQKPIATIPHTDLPKSNRPRTALPKSNRKIEAQGSIMSPAPSTPTPNLSSIRLGMKALNLVKFIK